MYCFITHPWHPEVLCRSVPSGETAPTQLFSGSYTEDSLFQRAGTFWLKSCVWREVYKLFIVLTLTSAVSDSLCLRRRAISILRSLNRWSVRSCRSALDFAFFLEGRRL